MEGYKKIFRSILTPSIIVLLSVSGTILLINGIIFRAQGEFAAAISIFLAAVILSVPVIRTSVAVKAQENNNMFAGCRGPSSTAGHHITCKYLKLSVLLVPILCVITGRVVLLHYGKNPSAAAVPGVYNLEKTRIKRYNRELLLKKISSQEMNSDIFSRRRTVLAYCDRDIALHSGDTIVLLSKPRNISREDYHSSPYLRMLLRKGIDSIIYLKGKDFRLADHGKKNLRRSIRERLDEAINAAYNKKTGNYLRALYFGNKNYLDKETLFKFKQAGVLHVLAASGLHVGIIAAVPFFLLAAFRLDKRIILVLAVVVIFFYLYITDMPVSLMRAFAMFAIYGTARLLDLEHNIVNTLFTAAVLILILYPYELYSLGFQLSFGATLGIILLFRFYRSSLKAFPAFLGNSFAVTLAAQAAVFPIILIHMQEINLIGILSNLVVVPAVGLAMIVSIFSTGLSLFCPVAAGFAGLVPEIILDINKNIVDCIAAANAHFNDVSEFYFLSAAFVLYLMPVFFFNRRRKMCMAAILFSFLLSYFVLAGQSEQEKDIKIIRARYSSVMIYHKDRHALICGRIGDRPAYDELVHFLNKNSIYTVQLVLPYINRYTIMNFNRLAKNKLVTGVILDSRFYRSSVLENFLRTLKIDGIPWKISSLRPVLPYNISETPETVSFCKITYHPPEKTTFTGLKNPFFKRLDQILNNIFYSGNVI